MRPRTIGGTLAAPLLALAVALTAGCANKKEEGIATAGGQPTVTASAAAQGDRGEQFRKFAQCMRENGVDVPDPGPDGNYSFDGQGGGNGPGADIDRADPKFQAAMTACRSLMPAGGIPIKLNPQQLEQYRLIAACMRDHGIDFPDPNADGSLGIDMANAERLMDRNNPAFTKAIQACVGQQFGRTAPVGTPGATPGATP